MIRLKLSQRWYSTARRKHSLPENWSECSPKLAAFALNTLVTHDRPTAMIIIAAKILRMSLRKISKFPTSVLDQITDPISWMNTDPVTTAIIPEFVLDGQLFRFPTDTLGNSSTAEFRYLDEFIMKYREENDPEYLFVILATLATDHPDRIINTRAELFDRARHFQEQNISPGILISAGLYAIGVLAKIRDTYQPFVFPDPEDENASEGRPIRFGWFGWLLGIAQDGPFGNVQQCDRSHIHDLLMYTYKKNEDAHIEAERQRQNTPT